MFFFFLGAREPHESQELERFSAALDIVQTRYPNMTLGQLSTLLRVGMTPQNAGENTSVSDIVAKTNGQKYPTVARQLDLLGEGTGQVPGMGLIEKETDPNDRRNRWVGISEKGKTLIYELDLILAPQILEKSDSNTQSYT
ncbi:winged helix-turn-helix transcriptional regulator [Devosia sp. MC532]|uniref:MarR family winged helix-turn-helix transcriptional regulator n=1 Tax=Devosia sp. MC532 TaxID=2799788 RepID=UPI0018F629A0|nr:MarR family winged helix-turn-helix transcriptional regulator [Devosia sp. MC532]MBJ7578424.1 winged helix-turn-helix transcriptional regulator [Devosia sp. MC532]